MSDGGCLLHGASSGLGEFLGVVASPGPVDSITWEEEIVMESPSFAILHSGKALARFLDSGGAAITLETRGKGEVLSFGFDYGYAYQSRIHPPVPRRYGRSAQFPLSLLRQTPIAKYLRERELALHHHPDVERVPFEKGTLIVNHSAYPVAIDQPFHEAHCTCGTLHYGKLPGHASVFLVNVSPGH